MQHPSLPVIGCAQSILMRDSQGRDSFTKDTLLSASDWLLLVQLFTSGEEGLQGQRPRPRKTKRPCNVAAACFTLSMAPRRRFVLDGATRAVVATKSFPCGQDAVHLARRFFTQKHRLSQQREDCAEVFRAEPLSNIALILASF